MFLKHPGRDYLEALQAAADTGFLERPRPNYQKAKELSQSSGRDCQVLEPAASTKFPEQTKLHGLLLQRPAAGTEHTGRDDCQRQMPAGSDMVVNCNKPLQIWSSCNIRDVIIFKCRRQQSVQGS